MRRRRLIAFLMLALAVFGGGGTVFALTFWHVPSFYKRGQIPSGPERRAQTQEFLHRSSDLFGRFTESPVWAQEFTQDQINSYLQDEDFSATSLIEIPEGIEDPRIAFEDDRLRVGFRYGKGLTSAVVSVDLRMWLVAKESNTIALEVGGMWLGGVPLGSHLLLEAITDAAREKNMDVTWYRRGKHPVAILRLQANNPRPTFQLQSFEIQTGKLIISGKNTPVETGG